MFNLFFQYFFHFIYIFLSNLFSPSNRSRSDHLCLSFRRYAFHTPRGRTRPDGRHRTETGRGGRVHALRTQDLWALFLSFLSFLSFTLFYSPSLSLSFGLLLFSFISCLFICLSLSFVFSFSFSFFFSG